jgi:hypothetical protein
MWSKDRFYSMKQWLQIPTSCRVCDNQTRDDLSYAQGMVR